MRSERPIPRMAVFGRRAAAWAAVCVLFVSSAARAQYDLGWYTIDGGGYMWSAGGSFTLGGTIGQPDASVTVMTGGTFTLAGGFWYGPGDEGCYDPPQDVNGDGDVDLFDFQDFRACFNGPNQPWQVAADPRACACFDVNGDADVDLADFQEFRACFNGPNRPPACP